MTTLAERHRDRVRTRSIHFVEQVTPVFDEISAIGDDSFARSLGWYSGEVQLNPDPILRGQAGNLGVALYEDMERKDPNLASDLDTRRLAVVGLDWEIDPASADQADADVADWVKAVLTKIPGFKADLEQLLDAIGKGYAVSEILWSARPDGRIGIAEIKSRHQQRFVFGTAGDLRLLSDADMTRGTAVPPKKFLVHSFRAAHENPYGTALCGDVYWYVWFKRNAVKFWALFNEKYGSPTAVGKYPPGSDPSLKSRVLSILRAIQQETAIAVPDNVVVELLEAKREGSVTTYDSFLSYLDRQVTKRVLGQTLTTTEGERSGSLALGRIHAQVRQDILEADAASLAGVINSQLIPWLVDWNFLVAAYPTLHFKLDPPTDLGALVQRDDRLQGMGLPIPVTYAQNRYGIPAPQRPDDVLVRSASAIPAGLSPGFAEIFRAVDQRLDLRGER